MTSWGLLNFLLASLCEGGGPAGPVGENFAVIRDISGNGKALSPTACGRSPPDHVCSPIVLAVILFREFAVAGVRMLAAETGTVIAANMWGKVKTVLQMLTIIFYYFVGALAGPTDVGFVSFVSMVLCWLCGAATLLSGGIYLWQNRKLFMQAK